MPLDNKSTTSQQTMYSASTGDEPSPGAVPVFSYKQSEFNKSDYSVTGLSYPEDLMSNSKEHGDNTVIFYINASVDSRIFKQGAEVTAAPVQRSMRGGMSGQNITKVLNDNVVAEGIKSILSSANDNESKAEAEKILAFSRPQKQLKAAIALHMPNQIAARYSVGWGEEDTFALSALAKGADELGRSVSNDANLKRTGGVAGEVAASILLEKGPLGKGIGVATGLAGNPKKEQAFKNVDFRTFTFEYQFSPKSETEARNVLNIIRAFKYHMHPEFTSANQFLYVYPSEFDIVYYKGGQENLNIHRHTSCVLTEMNINYSPNGVFSTFKNGMPTQISVTMTFKELMLLTKESIEKYT